MNNLFQEYVRNVLAIFSSIKFIFGNKSELEMFLETVDSLPDASEEHRTLVTSVRQALGSPEEGDTDLAIEEDGQYAIVTDAQHPISGVSLK